MTMNIGNKKIDSSIKLQVVVLPPDLTIRIRMRISE